MTNGLSDETESFFRTVFEMIPQMVWTKDAAGRVVKWFGTTTDIDEQKRYAQRQEQIASALSRLFEPYALPVLPTLTFDAVYLPAEDIATVGGDFYEALRLPDGRVLVAIGDVAGHLAGGEAKLLAAVHDAVTAQSEYPARRMCDAVLGGRRAPDDIAILTVAFHPA